MWRQIPNDRLTLADIPAAGAPWDAISEFALSYYGHTEKGLLRGEYDYDRPPLAADLDNLRAWLFSQQRSIRGGYVDDPHMLTCEALQQIGAAPTLPGVHTPSAAPATEFEPFGDRRADRCASPCPQA